MGKNRNGKKNQSGKNQEDGDEVSALEINYLVYRYLQESGYVHSAFTFEIESQLGDYDFDACKVPPGALYSFLQRGIHFLEIEDNLEQEDETIKLDKCDKVNKRLLLDYHKLHCKKRNNEMRPRESPNQADEPDKRAKVEDAEEDRNKADEKPPQINRENYKFDSSEVLSLYGHAADVYTCAWNPRTCVLASGSEDGTTRIWTIPSNVSAPLPIDPAATEAIVLGVPMDRSGQQISVKRDENQVHSVAWNPSGTILAVGLLAGHALAYTETGQLKYKTGSHVGAILHVHWNNSGTYLATGGNDGCTMVWNGETGKLIRRLHLHEQKVLMVQWKDEISFASCSTDGMIYLCAVNSNFPLHSLEGHEKDVNFIKFDGSGKYLASCSDDRTVKIWCTQTGELLHDLKDHTRDVYALEWCPNVENSKILASISFDSTVRIWDINTGYCIRSLHGHKYPIYCLSFSPDGDFLATGCMAGCLNIWSMKENVTVKKHQGSGGLFELEWNPCGNKLAACSATGTVLVFDAKNIIISGNTDT